MFKVTTSHGFLLHNFLPAARSSCACRCQLGIEAVLKGLPQAWPEGQAASAPAMQQLQICGPDAPPKEWVACKGSKPDTRGYTCGLWMLFHALAGQVEPEKSGGADWARAIR